MSKSSFKNATKSIGLLMACCTGLLLTLIWFINVSATQFDQPRDKELDTDTRGALQLSQPKTAVTYTLTITDPTSHRLHVGIEISPPHDETIELTIHSSVRPQETVTGFRAIDENANNLPVEGCDEFDTCLWVSTNDAQKILIEYSILQHFPDIPETRIGQDYAVVPFSTTLFRVSLSDNAMDFGRVKLNVPTYWDVLSDLNELDDRLFALESMNQVMAIDDAVVRTSLIVAGTLRQQVVLDGNLVLTVAIFEQVIEDGFPISLSAFAGVSKRLFDFYRDFFGGTTSTSPILVITPVNSGQLYGTNLLAQHYLSAMGEDKLWVCYPWNYTHHMAHAWWINALSFDADASPRYYLMKELINSYTNVLSLEGAQLWDEYAVGIDWAEISVGKTPDSVPALVKQDYNGYMGVFGTENHTPLDGSSGYTNLGGVAFSSVLDRRLYLLSGGSLDLGSFFAYLFKQNGGYWFNPEYLVDADLLLEELNSFSGIDWSTFFEHYVFGTELIPYLPYFYYDMATVSETRADFGSAQMNYSMAAALAPLFATEEVADAALSRLTVLSVDMDNDGLGDEWETALGTDLTNLDSDGDGLSDRFELGGIIDGFNHEFLGMPPLATDVIGDGMVTRPGLDIANVHAGIVISPDGEQRVHFSIILADERPEPLLEVSVELLSGEELVEVRFSTWWGAGIMGPEVSPQMAEQGDGGYASMIEVSLPMSALHGTDVWDVSVRTSYWDGPGNDWSPPMDELALADIRLADLPVIYVTDPLNFDTDGDGVHDGLEQSMGTDPTDPLDHMHQIYVPIIKS